jgi:hypothetical protein
VVDQISGEAGEKSRLFWGGYAVLSEILLLISQPGGTWVNYALSQGVSEAEEISEHTSSAA